MRKSGATGVLMSISLLSASALLRGVLLLQNDFLPGCRWTYFFTSCFFEADDTINDGVCRERVNCS